MPSSGLTSAVISEHVEQIAALSPGMRADAAKELICKIMKSSSIHSSPSPSPPHLSPSVPSNGDDDQTSINELVLAVENLTGESFGLMNARRLLNVIIDGIRSCPDQVTAKLHICEKLVSVLRSKLPLFEDQDRQLKELLAGCYEYAKQYSRAALVLQGISFDSSQCTLTNIERVELLLRIVLLYLTDHDIAKASDFLNRVKANFHEITDPSCKLRFAQLQAKLLDFQSQYIDAGLAYYSFSQDKTVSIDTDQAQQALMNSAICAVLAPSGSRRKRLLTDLVEDHRTHVLPIYDTLKRMSNEQILSISQLNTFANVLRPDQQATNEDGYTALERALIEHNLLALSEIYTNIRLKDLAKLLKLSSDKAEQFATSMIQTGRLPASIDQVDGFVYFDQPNQIREGSGITLDQLVYPVSRRWDRTLLQVMEDIDRLATIVSKMNRPMRG